MAVHPILEYPILSPFKNNIEFGGHVIKLQINKLMKELVGSNESEAKAC
jgi:hypothetical protein